MDPTRCLHVLVRLLGLGLLILAPNDATAQQSANRKIEESRFNAGGTPANGNTAASAGFRISLDALGDGVGGGSSASASFTRQSGFVAAFAPPGEVSGLRFTDATTLAWDPSPVGGEYNLYRDLLGNLAALGFGACVQQGLVSAGASEVDLPPGGDGYFYLVTVVNPLGEEGTRGSQSDGSERLGTPCP